MSENIDARRRGARLGCWSGPVAPEPIVGGITNTNFVVHDEGERYFVRMGEDLPMHGILRFNETAIATAAANAGVSPEVIHSEPGALVIRFIDGHTLTAADVRSSGMLERIVPLVGRAHNEIPRYLRGPVLMFWVFHVIRGYASRLAGLGSNAASSIPGFDARTDALERSVGRIDLVLGHNDLLAANFIDDGDRLWLIDWDYGGFNSPLFDLGGLASNSELSPDQEAWLLEAYYGEESSQTLRLQFQAMKCASLLRETLWSMTSALTSTIDADFDAYSTENLARFEMAFDAFENAGGAAP
jgi:thiamine kinase-like enzyme